MKFKGTLSYLGLVKITSIIFGVKLDSAVLRAEGGLELPPSKPSTEKGADKGALKRFTALRFSYRLRVPVVFCCVANEAGFGSWRELQTEGGLASRTAESGEADDKIELDARPKTDWLSAGRPGRWFLDGALLSG